MGFLFDVASSSNVVLQDLGGRSRESADCVRISGMWYVLCRTDGLILQNLSGARS